MNQDLRYALLATVAIMTSIIVLSAIAVQFA